MRPVTRAIRRTLIAAALALAAGAASAQDNTIHLLVGLAPGGANDVAARIVAEKLKDVLGQPVIVDNKLGAGQRVALLELKRAAPDGRTLMLATSSLFTINPHIYAKLDYDPVKDFTPLSGVMNFDIGIAVGPKTPGVDFKQWVSWAKAHPREASFGTPGAGTLSHFLGYALARAIDVDMPMVPYKGGVPATTDLAGGQLPLLVNGLSDLLELHRAGRIRVIAVTGETSSPDLPEVPTLLELGLPVYSVSTVGIFGPAGMAPELAARLSRAIMQVVALPDTKQRFAKYGLVPAPVPPQQLAATLAAESKRLAELVKQAGVQPE